MVILRFLKVAFCLLVVSCSVIIDSSAQDDLLQEPEYSQADYRYADVFEILDGEWQGEFIIYEDSKPSALSVVNLNNLSLANLDKKSIKEVNRIKVKQVYTSESRYFQRVVITDTYPDSDKVEVSNGVNKIEDGKMWCIVNKPNETIVHSGSTRDNNTILWQSYQNDPQKIEFFQETVGGKYYEIIGFGYYTKDDSSKSPPLWFYGKYERQ